MGAQQTEQSREAPCTRKLLNEVERGAWRAFKAVTTSFLGNSATEKHLNFLVLTSHGTKNVIANPFSGLILDTLSDNYRELQEISTVEK
jgi:hypothetical protein